MDKGVELFYFFKKIHSKVYQHLISNDNLNEVQEESCHLTGNIMNLLAFICRGLME
jgi:hypothetical protein